jgi:hypothetical protein
MAQITGTIFVNKRLNNLKNGTRNKNVKGALLFVFNVLLIVATGRTNSRPS